MLLSKAIFKKFWYTNFKKALTWGLSEGSVEAVQAQVGKEFPDTEHFSAVDWSPNILGRVNSFPEPTAHFHSLKIQRSPAGRLSLGDWLGRYRCLLDWASLPNLESGSLLVMIRGLLATVTKGLDYLWRWPWSWVLLLWPCCKACTCGLGARLNSTETIFFKYH